MRIARHIVNKITRFKGVDPTLSRRKIRNLPNLYYDQEDIHYNWDNGDCVGYTVNPKLYKGRAPKKVLPSRNKRMTARKKISRQTQRKLAAHTAPWWESATYSEFSMQVDNFLREYTSPPPLDLTDPEEKLLNDRLMAAVEAGGNFDIDPSKDNRKKPYLYNRHKGYEPFLIDHSSPDFIIEGENRGVAVIPLPYVLLSEEAYLMSYPSPKYPKRKTLQSLVLPRMKFGEDHKNFIKKRLELLQPYLKVPALTRAKAFTEMAVKFLDRRTDYLPPNWADLDRTEREKFRINRI